jgi:hypothetical protein
MRVIETKLESKDHSGHHFFPEFAYVSPHFADPPDMSLL